MTRSLTITRTIVACSVLALLAACQGTDETLSREADIQAIIELDNDVHAAVEAGDLDAVMAFWTDDALIIAPNLPMVHGKAAVRSFFQAAFDSMTLEFERSSEEVIVSGDLAVHRGHTVSTYTPTGQASIEDPQKWVDVYRRQPDGSWLIWLTIWNSDLPAEKAIFKSGGGR